MNLNTVLTALGIIGFLAVAAATTVAYLRANIAKTTIETLEQNNKALIERVSILEGSGLRQAERIAALEAENATLRSIVTGVEELKRLRSDLAEHREHTKALGDQILTSVYSVHDLMLELLKRRQQ